MNGVRIMCVYASFTPCVNPEDEYQFCHLNCLDTFSKCFFVVVVNLVL